jgi:hypothetical protein
MMILLLGAAVALGTPPALTAADSAQCAAKPFTLNKPAPPTQKAAEPSKVAQATPAKARPAAKPPKSKEVLLATCKHGKPKKPA